MIEFKGACGHTVRARDEDAGQVVRCSYCGGQAKVPNSNGNDGLEALFDEINTAAPSPEAVVPRRRRSRGFSPFAATRRREFNPFTVIVKLIYLAALIAVVAVVVRMFLLPYFRDQPRSETARRTARDGASEHVAEGRRAETRAANRERGLLALAGDAGLYVTSVPDGAAVAFAPSSSAPKTGRIESTSQCRRARTDGSISDVSDGSYVLEFVMAWNDPKLITYPGYREFRRSIEDASDREAEQLAGQYFLPDEADAVFVYKTPEQIYLVRQYRNVHVRSGQWSSVHALFLPRVTKTSSQLFWIERLVTDYLPRQKAYGFDESHVRNELDYYGVPVEDREYVIDALSRIGVVPYVIPEENKTRLFKIGISDGVFAAKVIRQN